MANKIFDFQLALVGSTASRAMRTPGGMALFVTAGGTQKLALQDINGAAITNPVALVNGRVQARVATSVVSADIYILSPTGHFVQALGEVPGARQTMVYDEDVNTDVYTIPFNIADYPAATETLTGFTLAKDVMVNPMGAAVLITVAETAGAATMGFGINSAESNGSATGFGVAVPTGVLGMIPLKSAATATRGSFLGGSTLDKPYRCDGTAKTISITPVTASVAVAGFLILPVIIPPSLIV